MGLMVPAARCSIDVDTDCCMLVRGLYSILGRMGDRQCNKEQDRGGCSASSSPSRRQAAGVGVDPTTATLDEATVDGRDRWTEAVGRSLVLSQRRAHQQWGSSPHLGTYSAQRHHWHYYCHYHYHYQCHCRYHRRCHCRCQNHFERVDFPHHRMQLSPRWMWSGWSLHGNYSRRKRS